MEWASVQASSIVKQEGKQEMSIPATYIVQVSVNTVKPGYGTISAELVTAVLEILPHTIYGCLKF